MFQHTHALRQLVAAAALVLLACLGTAQAATDAEVRAAQQHLAALGYNPGPVDGKMGPRTRTALLQYQYDSGLPATGRLDDLTATALQENARATTPRSTPRPYADTVAVNQRPPRRPAARRRGTAMDYGYGQVQILSGDTEFSAEGASITVDNDLSLAVEAGWGQRERRAWLFRGKSVSFDEQFSDGFDTFTLSGYLATLAFGAVFPFPLDTASQDWHLNAYGLALAELATITFDGNGDGDAQFGVVGGGGLRARWRDVLELNPEFSLNLQGGTRLRLTLIGYPSPELGLMLALDQHRFEFEDDELGDFDADFDTINLGLRFDW